MTEGLVLRPGTAEVRPESVRRGHAVLPNLDPVLLTVLGLIALLGLVMVGSASIAIADRAGDPFALLQRQALYAAFALVAATVVLQLPLRLWQALSTPLLVVGYALLVLVLIPGVGREVNGAVRWLPLVVVQLQVSEVAKVCVYLYLAAYLVRRAEAVRASHRGFLVPVGVLVAGAILLLAEPDFGAAAVLMATGLVMLFLAGAPLWRFLLLVATVAGAAAALVVTSPYRWERLTAFMDPWADPFDSGFQLTQALIAIGRGGWFGVGLGNSVQKLFYLPEAHTDFLFAVLAEELGLIGVVTVVALYAVAVWRIFRIGSRSLAVDHPFGAYLAWGVGFWLALQAFVNMGVNMGVLPTKGLTLPLMSYGGSSLVMTAVALALVLRVDAEARVASRSARPVAAGGEDG